MSLAEIPIADYFPELAAESAVEGEVFEEPRRRLLTPDEFLAMAEAGFYADEKVELIDGEVFITVSPMSASHETCIMKMLRILMAIFGDDYSVRPQLSITEPKRSRPEPDLAVVPGDPDANSAASPTTAVLVVEVAVTSLRFDLGRKARLYARMGIPEYWVIDVINHKVHEHRDPADASGYRSVVVRLPGETLDLLSKPEASIAVTSLFGVTTT